MRHVLRTELRRDAISIYAKDLAKDTETQNLFVNISGNQIHKTGKLPGKSKLYIEARVNCYYQYIRPCRSHI